MPDDISKSQFQRELRAKIKELGGKRKALKVFGITRSLINAVLRGTELPGPSILKVMKLKPIKTISYRYERVD